MDCAPMLSRRKRYHFEAVVRLHSLSAVPYVNAVTFAKLRLLDTRHSSQFSTRFVFTSIRWDKCIRTKETKGGKSFYKVGFVIVNLASFTAMGSATCRRRYILEGYDEKHKRQDNSLLSVAFSMRQIFGDTYFRM
ncbi:unnamed protein product [Echinostoma caproni]|uniref:C2 NT-type domain-containing protein n=1 Tax=Echinostoma caproni TaxID=27848 RepID=A0A183BET2_9TREM|nr:unnamed protein product [Echinostoma caproni]